MLRTLIILAIVFGLAFSIATVWAVIARADQEQTKPEQFTLATHSPLDAKTDVPRCWHREDEPTPVLWFVRVGNGVILVVHGEMPRKGC